VLAQCLAAGLDPLRWFDAANLTLLAALRRCGPQVINRSTLQCLVPLLDAFDAGRTTGLLVNRLPASSSNKMSGSLRDQLRFGVLGYDLMLRLKVMEGAMATMVRFNDEDHDVAIWINLDLVKWASQWDGDGNYLELAFVDQTTRIVLQAEWTRKVILE
jgi:hypothetical protein